MNVRKAALNCLIKILDQGKFYDEAFNLYSDKVNTPSELTNLLSGAVKAKLTLDYYIGKISSKNIKRLSPVVRNILRLAIYELDFTNNPDYAVVDSYVTLCKEEDKGAVSFVNAILRNFIRKRNEISIERKELGDIKYLSIKYSHPEWMVEKWIKTYGVKDTEEICEFNNRPRKLCLRVNTLKTNKEELINLFKTNNIDFEQSKYSQNCLIIKPGGNIKNIPGFEEGFWVIQGESSSMVAEILAPQAGEKILDFCAAPGGKTAYIAALLNDKGEVLAVDSSKRRIKKVDENITRLGITSVKTQVGEATEASFKDKFDKVLVDVPCSNTGVLGAKPDARWQKSLDDISSITKLQMNILKNAAEQVKQGGTLVYSTCSIEPEENTKLINRFLAENQNFQLVPFNDSDGMLQILQSKHNIDGFFIAKILKK